MGAATIVTHVNLTYFENPTKQRMHQSLYLFIGQNYSDVNIFVRESM